MAISTAHPETLKQAPGATSTVGLQVVGFAEVLLISVWVGSMVFFSFAVAPSAFAVLPSRELAGKVVTSAISKLEMLGLIVGPLLILIQLAAWRGRNAAGKGKVLRLILLFVMIAMAALSRFWVSATLVSLRLAMGGMIDDIPQTDPLRVQFNDMHRYSVALMATAMLAGFAVMFLTVRSWLKR
jgi:Domain of unknown function (DUF4149)